MLLRKWHWFDNCCQSRTFFRTEQWRSTDLERVPYHPAWFCTLPKMMLTLSINTFSDIRYEMVEETNPKAGASLFKFLWIRSIVSIELWLTGEMNSHTIMEDMPRLGRIDPGAVGNRYCLMRRQALSDFINRYSFLGISQAHSCRMSRAFLE